MSALFEMSLSSETLNQEELQAITGCARRADQVAWLKAEGWAYVQNRAGEPIVGRLYARLKLAGISPNALISPGGWTPNFDAIR